jgi:hypothetical protein
MDEVILIDIKSYQNILTLKETQMYKKHSCVIYGKNVNRRTVYIAVALKKTRNPKNMALMTLEIKGY